MNTPRVLNVGQCGYDGGRIARHLKDRFQAQTVSVDTLDESLTSLRSGGYKLILINRLFDIDGTPGLDLIRAIKADPSLSDLPTMLISNYPEAQADAVALGALPGFGKADIGRARVDEILGSIIGGVGSKSS